MKLTDFDKNTYASKALEEQYKVSFNVSHMDMISTKDMLKKVRTLAMEAKQSSDFYKSTPTQAYMKLVFMEEALVNHYNDLASRPKPQIVVENEKIEESQVYLAAQDMVDSINKMLEEIGEMQVKELPALVDSIESEIGVNESQTFQEQVGAQLDTLSAALKEAQGAMKSAVGQLTGVGGPGFDAGADMGAEMPPEPGGEEMTDVSVDTVEPAPEEPMAPEAPEMEPMGGVGRAKR